ncbi:hypothetical protein GCM10029978_110690 [Actinoallomurus acanthiterrae]
MGERALERELGRGDVVIGGETFADVKGSRWPLIPLCGAGDDRVVRFRFPASIGCRADRRVP